MVLTRSTNNIEKDILQRTQPLNHFHDMRRKKDRDTTLSQIMQNITDDPRTNRIDAFKWFIEKNDLRTVNNRCRQCNLLTHTHRIIDNQLICITVQRQYLLQPPRPASDICLWHTIHKTGEDKKFLSAQPLIDIQIFRQYSHKSTRLQRMLQYNNTTHLHRTRC